MVIKLFLNSNRERLTVVCEEKPHKPVRVRGHIRVVNGHKIYVKAHYRHK